MPSYYVRSNRISLQGWIIVDAKSPVAAARKYMRERVLHASMQSEMRKIVRIEVRSSRRGGGKPMTRSFNVVWTYTIRGKK